MLTRRQADHALTRIDTRALEFSLEGHPLVPAAEIEPACHKTIELVRRFCSGRRQYELLSEQNPKHMPGE